MLRKLIQFNLVISRATASSLISEFDIHKKRTAKADSQALNLIGKEFRDLKQKAKAQRKINGLLTREKHMHQQIEDFMYLETSEFQTSHGSFIICKLMVSNR